MRFVFVVKFLRPKRSAPRWDDPRRPHAVSLEQASMPCAGLPHRQAPRDPPCKPKAGTKPNNPPTPKAPVTAQPSRWETSLGSESWYGLKDLSVHSRRSPRTVRICTAVATTVRTRFASASQRKKKCAGAIGHSTHFFHKCSLHSQAACSNNYLLECFPELEFEPETEPEVELDDPLLPEPELCSVVEP